MIRPGYDLVSNGHTEKSLFKCKYYVWKLVAKTRTGQGGCLQRDWPGAWGGREQLDEARWEAQREFHQLRKFKEFTFFKFLQLFYYFNIFLVFNRQKIINNFFLKKIHVNIS